MKKAISLIAAISLLAVMVFTFTGCSGIEGTFVRTKQDDNLTMTYTMTFLDDRVTYETSYYDSYTYESEVGTSKMGSYVTDSDMVYITWDDGDRDTFIYNDTAGSLSHTVEDWMVYYRE